MEWQLVQQAGSRFWELQVYVWRVFEECRERRAELVHLGGEFLHGTATARNDPSTKH